MNQSNKNKIYLQKLNNKILNCKKCPRLYSYIKFVSKNKVKRYKDEIYWGKPLSGFGDINGELLLIGLAPAAHGGNRTGRMFTGDSSGDWVARVLYENGFATKPTSEKLSDGFNLINTYITAVVRCAPPENKPLKEEFENCYDYIQQEILLLKNLKIIICLGRIAFTSCCKLFEIRGASFSHGKSFKHKNIYIICSYHPSRQNTQTRKLTWKQWNNVFIKTKLLLNKKNNLDRK